MNNSLANIYFAQKLLSLIEQIMAIIVIKLSRKIINKKKI
jgi:hypothetical protein